MKSRGRKKVLHPEQDVINIVKKYLETEQPIGKIKYIAVFKFAKKLYLDKESLYDLSEDFWRKDDRQGKKIIDGLNDIRNTVARTDKDYFEVVPTSNIVNELSNDFPSIKKKIIARLKSNEHGYRRLIEKYKNLLNKEQKLKDEIEHWKTKYHESVEKNNIYEQVLFQWANISSARDLKLINTITTGKTRSKVVEQLLTDMFNEDSNAAYKNINKTSEEINNNIIELRARPKNTLIEDLDL